MHFKGYGPMFGDKELGAHEGPFNKKLNCVSFSGKFIYGISEDDREINAMTKSKSCAFTITELEVWQLI